MTRIIGGSAGGRRLRAPAGDGTRPTSDRVREALFSALEARLGSLRGIRFLDLYAGSGAVGLEALSRGAAAALLVEADRRAAGVAAANAAALGLAARVLPRKVEQVLGASPGPASGEAFDVAFLDPPYPLPEDELAAALALLVDRGWLAPGALAVVERSARSVEPAWPTGLGPAASKRYGETVLWYVRRDSDTGQGRREE